ncbi:sporulation protein YjcZ [Cohnella fermenti]|nr:sporulation protein YjcZ [Cohnella fermenti]
MSQSHGIVYGHGASTTIIIVLFILLVIVLKAP